jgi:hypothetical protein
VGALAEPGDPGAGIYLEPSLWLLRGTSGRAGSETGVSPRLDVGVAYRSSATVELRGGATLALWMGGAPFGNDPHGAGLSDVWLSPGIELESTWRLADWQVGPRLSFSYGGWQNAGRANLSTGRYARAGFAGVPPVATAGLRARHGMLTLGFDVVVAAAALPDAPAPYDAGGTAVGFGVGVDAIAAAPASRRFVARHPTATTVTAITVGVLVIGVLIVGAVIHNAAAAT